MIDRALSLRTFPQQGFGVAAKAVSILQHVISNQMWEILEEATQSTDLDVNNEAIKALFYLGTKDAIAMLLNSMQTANSALHNELLYRIHGLTNVYFEPEHSQARLNQWWAENQIKYQGDTCYRLGRPLEIPMLIELLHDLRQIKSVAKEFYIITGCNLHYYRYMDDFTPLISKAEDWWSTNKHNYLLGAVYKYGRLQQFQARDS